MKGILLAARLRQVLYHYPAWIWCLTGVILDGVACVQIERNASLCPG